MPKLTLMFPPKLILFFLLTNITIIHSVASTKPLSTLHFTINLTVPNSVLSSTPQNHLLALATTQGTTPVVTTTKLSLTALPQSTSKALLVGCPDPFKALSTATRTTFKDVNLIFYLLKFGRGLLTVVLKIKIQVFIGLWGPVTCGPSPASLRFMLHPLTH